MPTRSQRLFYSSRRHCSQYVHLSLSSPRSIKYTLTHPICLKSSLMLGSRHIALGILSRLLAVRKGVRIPAEARRYALLQPYPTVLGPIQSPQYVSTGCCFPGDKAVDVKNDGATLPLLHMPSRHAQAQLYLIMILGNCPT